MTLTLEEIKKRIESPEFKEYAQKWAQEYKAKRDKLKRKVSSDEYINWLYDYVIINKSVNDESALYTYIGIDAENGSCLGSFLDYTKELAKEQNIPIGEDEECYFPNELVTIKIKDSYFEVFRMFGQGSWTSVSLLEKAPMNDFVELG